MNLNSIVRPLNDLFPALGLEKVTDNDRFVINYHPSVGLVSVDVTYVNGVSVNAVFTADEQFSVIDHFRPHELNQRERADYILRMSNDGVSYGAIARILGQPMANIRRIVETVPTDAN